MVVCCLCGSLFSIRLLFTSLFLSHVLLLTFLTRGVSNLFWMVRTWILLSQPLALFWVWISFSSILLACDWTTPLARFGSIRSSDAKIRSGSHYRLTEISLIGNLNLFSCAQYVMLNVITLHLLSYGVLVPAIFFIHIDYTHREFIQLTEIAKLD